MKLFSCHNCGVVLDAERLIFVFRHELDNTSLSDTYEYTEDDYNVVTTCPVCKSIINTDGNS